MKVSEYLNTNNLHHAYLIEGARDEVVPEILKFCESLNIKTSGNPDFCHITIDNLKVDEALDLRTMSFNKSFSSGKRIFLICVNNFTLDAENVLLRMFEEPTENTHFFLIVPDVNALLKTLVSRFYVIKNKGTTTSEKAEKFISMSLPGRIDFIKELLAEIEEEDEEGNEIISMDSTRAKALKFLNTLELVLHNRFIKNPAKITHFSHFFKVRQFLRMPGSSTKTLMESVAIIIPNL
ncbi:MAG: hypothetical protein WD963_02275 [Candidatus Paceibacterota bacterium]